MPRIITLTTDFGMGSPYVAQMKGVILSICNSLNIVDITHEIPAQDVRQAAIVLSDTSRLFPPGTLHVAVVDPEVGSQREIVYIQIDGHAYIAPDNGLLSRVTLASPPQAIFALTESRFWREDVSSTFHGRDIMAPAAAHIASGVPPETLGEPRSELAPLPWPTPGIRDGCIRGSVLQIDSFGNLISDITREQIDCVSDGSPVRFSCQGQVTNDFVDHYCQGGIGTLVALVGSTGRLELSINGASAARFLGASVGDPVDVTW